MAGILAALAIVAKGLTVTAPGASGGATSGGYVPPITAVASGGDGTYAFSWEFVSGDFVTINSPNSATTSFDFGAVEDGGFRLANVRVTVTSGGQTAFCDTTVSFRNRTIV